jgi:cysteine synthase A
MIYQSILDCIGNTPVVKFEDIFVKMEGFNASGSVKDRPAKWMIDGMEVTGRLHPGDTIIEPTSGNMGISLAMIGAVKGYRVIMVMPDTMSIERQQLIKAFGAEIILTEGKKGMSGSIAEAQRLVKRFNYIMPSQFENYDNVISHEDTTGPEIIADFPKLDYLVCGIGTGGTITGTSKVLKKHYSNLKVIGVEPSESPMITKGQKGPHEIQGICAGFIPEILEKDLIDEMMVVKTEEARSETRRMARKGMFVGISSGAAFFAAKKVLKLNPDKIILVIAPDNGMKYLSTEVYTEVKK